MVAVRTAPHAVVEEGSPGAVVTRAATVDQVTPAAAPAMAAHAIDSLMIWRFVGPRRK